MTAQIQKIKERIQKQEEQLKQLKEQKRKAENKKNAKERAQKRKDETRMKILAGACALNIANQSEENMQKLLRSLDAFLTEDRDRELFGLPKKDS